MLVVLGFQLEGGLRFDDRKSLAAAVFLRLIVAAPLALLAGLAVGLEGLGLKTLIIISAMPVAVFTTILATQFSARPRFVTTAVILTTFLSIVTLTGVVTVVRDYI
jgi:predicted permease